MDDSPQQENERDEVSYSYMVRKKNSSKLTGANVVQLRQPNQALLSKVFHRIKDVLPQPQKQIIFLEARVPQGLVDRIEFPDVKDRRFEIQKWMGQGSKAMGRHSVPDA